MSSLTDSTWVETFGLRERIGTPDLLSSPEDAFGSPHAAAVRAAFQRNIQAFLSIEGIPTIAFAVRQQFDRQEIDNLHRALWNQGLASVLVVQLPTEIRVYSLWQRPIPPGTVMAENRDRRFVETLDLVADLLRIRNLVPTIESGHYFEEHPARFDPAERIDATLLRNLKATQSKLTSRGLADDVARALILQIIFIAYLEDRHVIDSEYFRAALRRADITGLTDLLRTRDSRLLARLFRALHQSFNGDVFYDPGGFQAGHERLALERHHLDPLAEFREGLVEMETDQMRFWPYDFSFIPVELISAIYDRFLNEGDNDRRGAGAYFTPRFLADLVVDHAWNALDPAVRCSDAFTVLDPACGSAIFLVRMFQKMVEAYKHQHAGEPPPWSVLHAFLERLHGWDIEESAVRIGVFSLYVALLEQVHPPAIRALMAEGKVLPALLGRTLCRRDFFSGNNATERFDLIIGNPPWVSRRSEQTRSALEWCERHGRPAPGGEIAWAFVWKSAGHLAPEGRVALLLPAMGILLNHSRSAVEARRAWLEEIELIRIINFADVCFQLFEGADRPTILALYRLHACPGRDYEFEYWVPKAHRLLSATRLLIIPTVDRTHMRISSVREDPVLWKKRMWATPRDIKLLTWLQDLPKLGNILVTLRRAKRSGVGKWVIGQGFIPYNPDSTSPHHDFRKEPAARRYPFLQADDFRSWVIPTVTAAPWPTAKVYRRGFVDGFKGPHILIPQGVLRDQGFVRAAYVDQSVCFRHSIQAIRFPAEQDSRAKLLTAVLNSALAAWYYFHTSANFGADRAKVHEAQLLELPFPDPEHLADARAARQAIDEIVQIVDHLLANRDRILADPHWSDSFTDRANELVFAYYGLTKDEQALIEDAVREIIPSMQPRRDEITRLMHDRTHAAREEYARTLTGTLSRWMRPGVRARARLIEGDSAWVVLEISLNGPAPEVRTDRSNPQFERSLQRVMGKLPQKMSRNIEIHPDLKVFIEDSLYLIKPLSTRHWLRITALNDADEIAGDLLSLQPVAPRRKAGNERDR